LQQLDQSNLRKIQIEVHNYKWNAGVGITPLINDRCSLPVCSVPSTEWENAAAYFTAGESSITTGRVTWDDILSVR